MKLAKFIVLCALYKKVGYFLNRPRMQTTNHKSARLVNKEMSQLWRIPTPPDKCIFGDFFLEEFANAHQMLKSGKALGPDSLHPELLLHANSALKSWLNKFLSSCMHQLKLQKIWRRH